MLRARKAIFHLVSIAIMSLGLAQFSMAGVIDSNDLISAETRDARISRIDALIARADVADQLRQFGVSPELVSKRVHNMTDEELIELENGIDEQIAGGVDAIGVIGVVFLVLLILELVGVTDIFKAI